MIKNGMGNNMMFDHTLRIRVPAVFEKHHKIPHPERNSIPTGLSRHQLQHFSLLQCRGHPL
jgi:hypothetical protein